LPFTSSLDYATMFLVKGKPLILRVAKGGLLTPLHRIPGGEIAGRIEAVGRDIARLKPGDEVYGDTCRAGYGAFAEYICAPEGSLGLMPANLSFEEAAAVPQSAIVALQGLRAGGLDEHRAGGIEAAKHVLVYGSSGGIETLALQIAAALGARATGVCSGKNAELLRSLGADEAIDYTQENFALPAGRFDLILAVRAPLRDEEAALVEEPEGSPSQA
jgi:NADPH:quinone reductase-like Zn-dependent oxidoreductase